MTIHKRHFVDDARQRAHDEARAWIVALVGSIEDSLGEHSFVRYHMQFRLRWAFDSKADPTLSVDVHSMGARHMVNVIIGTEWLRAHSPEMWAQVVAWRLQGIDMENVIINEEE